MKPRTPEELQYLISDFKAIFNSDAGTNVLGYLSEQCLERAATFDRNNQYVTAHNEGRRWVIRLIREKLAAPDEPRQTEAKT